MRPCAQSLCSLCALLCLLLTPGALCDVLQPKAAEEVGPPRPPPPQILDLTRTQLQAVPHSPPNGSVWTLILNQNRISLDESDREALRSYRGLTHLYLEHNAVTEVTAGYFTQMPRLTLLSLCGNNISRLDAAAFSGLENLTHLDLSNTSLSRLPGALLSALPSLQELHTGGNPWNCSCGLDYSWTRLSSASGLCASPPSLLGRPLTEAAAYCSQPQTQPQTPPPRTSVSLRSRETGQPSLRSNETGQPSLGSSETGQPSLGSSETGQPSLGSSETGQPSLGSSETGQPSLRSSVRSSVTAQLNHSSGNDPGVGQGNSWKFTVCVVVLVLCTGGLLVCAVKGPSWYRLFHNYRHRRLQEHNGTTIYSHQGEPHIYTFQQDRGRRSPEEDEDEEGYYEDPYVRSEG